MYVPATNFNKQKCTFCIENEEPSGGSRPSPKGGGAAFEGLTMNVEFCEDNSDRSKTMRYS